jgi:hypothetical protein
MRLGVPYFSKMVTDQSNKKGPSSRDASIAKTGLRVTGLHLKRQQAIKERTIPTQRLS